MKYPLGQAGVRETLAVRSIGRVSRLALLCSAAALLPAAAMAQTAAPAKPDANASDAPQASQVQEVVVTGVRAAIDKALKIKRNADVIVDSISAEDIGKFPDDNIAEAIQRIPGVAIDRSGGEGQFVSINGLGPDFSLTLFNGRQIASTEPNRSFSFDTIASNLVSQINVYKTINADSPEGGLGGSIDVRTARPFDFPGFQATVNASYDYDTNSQTGSPQAAFVASDRFFDGRLGVLASFTHQHRRNLEYQATTTGGYYQNYFLDPVSQGYVADSRADAWRAWHMEYGETTSERTRDGGTAVIQFKPTETLTLTADYLYSKYTVRDTSNLGGAYLWAVLCAKQDANGNCLQGTPGTTINSQGYYTNLDLSGPVNGVPNRLGTFLWQYTTSERPTVTQLGGFNADWKPSPQFHGVFDAYWSSAINNNRGLDTLENLEMHNQPEYSVNFPASGVPQFNLMGNNLAAERQNLEISQVYNTGNYVLAINKGVRGDFDWAPNPGTHVKFGASYNDEYKANLGYGTPSPVDELYHATGMPGPLPSSIFTGMKYAGQPYGVTGSPFPIFQINPTALRAWMADPTNLLARPQTGSYQSTLDAFIKNGSSFAATKSGSSFSIDEGDIDGYGEIVQDFKIFSLPGKIVAGARYSQTNLVSSGTSRILTGYAPNTAVASNLMPLFAPGGTLPVTVKHDYGYFLPSVNAKLDVLPNLIFRFSASRTLSRPTLDDLAPSLTGFGGTILMRTASGANPDLRPFTSTNFDVSAEWYYSKRGAVAISGFHKDAKDFIVRLSQPEKITTITALSPGVPLTLDQLQATAITRPHNAADATVEGLTFSWTHSIPLGFGVQANYTKVSSSTHVAPGLPAFAMPGVSDTANLVGFYEKGRLSARIAVNWRSAFLQNPGDNIPGSEQRAEYEDAYYQVDGRVGFDIGWGATLGANVVNLLDAKVRWYSGTSSNFDALYSYGRQVSFTLAKKF